MPEAVSISNELRKTDVGLNVKVHLLSLHISPKDISLSMVLNNCIKDLNKLKEREQL
jgi:hypothetical protein